MVCLLIWSDLLTDLGWFIDRICRISHRSWLVLTDLAKLVINLIKLLNDWCEFGINYLPILAGAD